MSEELFSWATPNTHLRQLNKLRKLHHALHPLCTPSQRRALVKVADVFFQKRTQNTFCDYSTSLKVLLDAGFPLAQAEVVAEMVAGSPEFWIVDTASRNLLKS